MPRQQPSTDEWMGCFIMSATLLDEWILDYVNATGTIADTVNMTKAPMWAGLGWAVHIHNRIEKYILLSM